MYVTVTGCRIENRCALRRSEVFTHVPSTEDWHCLARIIPSADLRFHDEGILSTGLRIVLRLCDGVSSQSLWRVAPSTSHSFSGCTAAVKTFIKLPGRSFSSQTPSYRKLTYWYSQPAEISPSQYADSTHSPHILSLPRFGLVPEWRIG